MLRAGKQFICTRLLLKLSKGGCPLSRDIHFNFLLDAASLPRGNPLSISRRVFISRVRPSEFKATRRAREKLNTLLHLHERVHIYIRTHVAPHSLHVSLSHYLMAALCSTSRAFIYTYTFLIEKKPVRRVSLVYIRVREIISIVKRDVYADRLSRIYAYIARGTSAHARSHKYGWIFYIRKERRARARERAAPSPRICIYLYTSDTRGSARFRNILINTRD